MSDEKHETVADIVKSEIEYVDKEDYRIYNLAIERLAKVITELCFAIENCKDLEDHGFEINYFKLQDAITYISTVLADTVMGLKYIKPKE